MAEDSLLHKADAAIPKFRRLALNAFAAGQRKVSTQKIAAALASKNRYAVEAEADKGLLRVEEVLRESLTTLVLNLMAVGGNVTGAELPVPPSTTGPVVMRSQPLQRAVRFDRNSPEAIRWAERYAANRIKALTEESRDAINHVIAQRLSVGASTSQTANVIKMSIGLTEPHATAVMNLSARLAASPGKTVRAGSLVFRVPKNGMSESQATRALMRYSEKLVKVRAQNIARTLTSEATNEGRRQMWSQARAKGLLSGNEKRQWMATVDACPICQDLDGELATLEGTFVGGYHNPPAHPGCRCTQSLTYD